MAHTGIINRARTKRDKSIAFILRFAEVVGYKQHV